MKTFIISLALLFAMSINGQQSYTSKKGDLHLLGNIDLKDLEKEPYSEWFNTVSKEDFSLSNPSLLNDIQVRIFIGTWCGDTKEWLPKFVQMWEKNGLSRDQLVITALHNEDEQYKRSPGGEEVDLDIHRVPAFIFTKQGKEVGRIVESPINDLVTDMEQIAGGIPSKPRYRAASILFAALDEAPVDTLLSKKHYRPLLKEVYGEISKPSELNTLGYVFQARGQVREAELAFYLNCNMFRTDPNTWDSLGEIYYDQGRYEEAQAKYERVLELNSESENAKEMLKKIEERT